MIRAFLLGILEFRRSISTHFELRREARAYDLGRELAHKVTLRKFES